jgi:hypothetical protein
MEARQQIKNRWVPVGRVTLGDKAGNIVKVFYVLDFGAVRLDIDVTSIPEAWPPPELWNYPADSPRKIEY